MPAVNLRLVVAPTVLLALASLAAACGDDSSPAEQSAAGSAGQAAAGSGQSAGAGGSSGTGGSGQAGSAQAGSGQAGEGSAGSEQAGSGGSETGGGAGQGGSPCDADCEKFKTPPDQKAEPPGPNGGGEADGAEPLYHALSTVNMGDVAPDGADDPDAWKNYGFDLDGWSSTAKQSYHCKPQAGGIAADIRADGNGGIDNSFGKNIVNGFLKTFLGSMTKQTTESLQSGSTSTLIDLGKVGAQPSYTGLLAQVFPVEGQRTSSGSFIKPPPGNWKDYAWRPFSDALEPDSSSKTKLKGAYMADNVWVSGEPSELRLRLAFEAGVQVELVVRQARLKVDLSDRAAGKAGIVGGLLETEVLVDTFRKLAGYIDTDLCGNSVVLASVEQQIRQASDILIDGTQDPAQVCNGISLGLGFESLQTKLGKRVDPPTPVDPCEAP